MAALSPALAMVDSLARTDRKRLVSLLSNKHGAYCRPLAEEAVQEAFLLAIMKWPLNGIPEKPAAWLYVVASRNLLDTLQWNGKHSEIETEAQISTTTEHSEGYSSLATSQLNALVMAAIPELTIQARLSAGLKWGLGLSVHQIGSILLEEIDTVAQRLSRTRKLISTHLQVWKAGSANPDSWTTSQQDHVLQLLYLLFTIGVSPRTAQVSSSANNKLADTTIETAPLELCLEAVRLAKHWLTFQPEHGAVHALLALFYFSIARQGPEGASQGATPELMLLFQDRTQWDQETIRAGYYHLKKSQHSALVSPYHLHAGIAERHVAAATLETTDWPAILRFYNMLAQLEPTPVVLLNRVVAISMVLGPHDALAAAQPLRTEKTLGQYPWYYATLAWLHAQLGESDLAKANYLKSLEYVTDAGNKAWLLTQLAKLNPVN